MASTAKAHAAESAADRSIHSKWPREFLRLQTEVSAAGENLETVMTLVLDCALRLVPTAAGGEAELRRGDQLECIAAKGLALRTVGESSPIAGNLQQFCAFSGANPRATALHGVGGRPESTITAPIPFEGKPAGVVRLHARGVRAFDDDDLLALQLIAGVAIFGVARDAQAREELAREQADRRFKATFDQAAVGIAHVAPDGRFILVNDRFCEIAGHDRISLVEGGFQRITHPDDLEADLAHVESLIAGRTQSYSMEKRYIRSDGSIAWINLTVSLIRKPDGSPDFFVSVIEDESARRAAEIDAEHDELTGLLNRRGAQRRLEEAMNAAAPAGKSLAVAYLDLDGFKAVNDRHGHAEGDRCLIKIAHALTKSVRGGDLVARLGGDEFLAVFADTSDLALDHVLERLRSNVAAAAADEDWDVSASVGVLVIGADCGLDAQAIIEAADNLMYRAKQAKSDAPVVARLPAAA